MRSLFYQDAFTFKWNDVGYQFTPNSSGIQHSRHSGEGSVLLWNTSYVEEILVQLQELDPHPATKHNVKVFAQYFVPGVGSATFEPASKSHLRNAGLAYTQFYNNVKDFWAAGDVSIAQEATLTDLAQDPQVIAAFYQIAQAMQIDQQALLDAYQHMKRVIQSVSRGSRYKSSSLRWEARLNDDALDRLDRNIQSQEDAGTASVSTHGPASHVAISSRTFAKWVRWNVNRLCFGFEYIYRSVTTIEDVSYEQTRAMNMYLRSLTCFFGHGPTGLHARLWQDRLLDRNDEEQQGFAMQDAMDHTNFPWLSKINFHTMTFETSVAPSLGFHHTNITRRLQGSSRDIRRFENMRQRRDETRNWLIRFRQSRSCLAYIFWYLHQLCVMVFRQDVFRYIHSRQGNKYRNNVILPEYRDLALDGYIALTYDHLDRDIKLPPIGRRAIAIKSDRRDKIRTYAQLFNRLFSKHDAHKRTQKEPYFQFFHVTRRMIRRALGPQIARSWYQEFYEYLRMTCWVLPVPGNNRFIVKDRGDRWYFFSQLNSDIQLQGRAANSETSFLEHHWNTQSKWWSESHSLRWYEHSKTCIRGRPRADTWLIDRVPSEFLAALEQLAEVEGVDADDAEDRDFNPDHHYASDDTTSEQASSSDGSDTHAPAAIQRQRSTSTEPNAEDESESNTEESTMTDDMMTDSMMTDNEIEEPGEVSSMEGMSVSS